MNVQKANESCATKGLRKTSVRKWKKNWEPAQVSLSPERLKELEEGDEEPGRGRSPLHAVIAEPFRFLEFSDLSNVHFLAPLWVTESCTEMKAKGALESCDFGLPKIASVPP